MSGRKWGSRLQEVGAPSAQSIGSIGNVRFVARQIDGANDWNWPAETSPVKNYFNPQRSSEQVFLK
jgi:hypothetical protein